MAVYLVMLVCVTLSATMAYRCFTESAVTQSVFLRRQLVGKAQLFVLAAGIILFLVSALRYNVGADYASYKYFIDMGALPDWEKGFVALIKLVTGFTQSYEVFIAVNSLIVVCIFCKCYQDYIHFHPLAVYLFISMGVYFQTFCLLRQGIAIGIVFYSYRYIVKKQYICLIACLLLAVLFHSAALIAVPAILLSNIKLKRIDYLYGTIAGVGLGMVAYNAVKLYVAIKYRGGHDQELDALLPIYSILLGIIALWMALVYRDRLIQKDESNNILINLALFYLIYTFLFAFAPVVSRVFQFFIPFLTLLFTQIVMAEPKLKQRRLYYVLISGGYLLFMCVLVRVSNMGVLPYQTIFNR